MRYSRSIRRACLCKAGDVLLQSYGDLVIYHRWIGSVEVRVWDIFAMRGWWDGEEVRISVVAVRLVEVECVASEDSGNIVNMLRARRVAALQLTAPNRVPRREQSGSCIPSLDCRRISEDTVCA